MPRILAILLLVLLMAGCSSAPTTSPQTFEIAGVKVEFSPPPPDWKVRKEPADKKETLAVMFDHPGGKGHLAVTVANGVKELDKPTLNGFGMSIGKRKGKIVKDEYIDVAGDKQNAYRMEFEVDSGDNRGLQVHFPKNGHLFSVIMTVPADQFASSQQIFDQVVRTFKVL